MKMKPVEEVFKRKLLQDSIGGAQVNLFNEFLLSTEKRSEWMLETLEKGKRYRVLRIGEDAPPPPPPPPPPQAAVVSNSEASLRSSQKEKSDRHYVRNGGFVIQHFIEERLDQWLADQNFQNFEEIKNKHFDAAKLTADYIQEIALEKWPRYKDKPSQNERVRAVHDNLRRIGDEREKRKRPYMFGDDPANLRTTTGLRFFFVRALNDDTTPAHSRKRSYTTTQGSSVPVDSPPSSSGEAFDDEKTSHGYRYSNGESASKRERPVPPSRYAEPIRRNASAAQQRYVAQLEDQNSSRQSMGDSVTLLEYNSMLQKYQAELEQSLIFAKLKDELDVQRKQVHQALAELHRDAELIRDLDTCRVRIAKQLPLPSSWSQTDYELAVTLATYWAKYRRGDPLPPPFLSTASSKHVFRHLLQYRCLVNVYPGLAQPEMRQQRLQYLQEILFTGRLDMPPSVDWRQANSYRVQYAQKLLEYQHRLDEIERIGTDNAVLEQRDVSSPSSLASSATAVTPDADETAHAPSPSHSHSRSRSRSRSPAPPHASSDCVVPSVPTPECAVSPSAVCPPVLSLPRSRSRSPPPQLPDSPSAGFPSSLPSLPLGLL